MSTNIIFNGNLIDEQHVSISINNRSFKYGDGCFETLKVLNEKIVSAGLHFTRLFSSLELLQFQVTSFFSAEYLTTLIVSLTQKNKHSKFARIRLTVFRGDGGLYDDINHEANFIIQSWAGNDDSNQFNNEGLELDFFHDAKKACDNFSRIKSNNYLPYAMGALYAKKNNLNDCLVLNCYDRIAETTIANVFIIINGVIKTPALSEGCVSGVMRKHLIHCLKNDDLPFVEGEINAEEILQASEVFLTNAIYGIRWVTRIQNSYYSNQMSSILHQKFIVPLFSYTTF